MLMFASGFAGDLKLTQHDKYLNGAWCLGWSVENDKRGKGEGAQKRVRLVCLAQVGDAGKGDALAFSGRFQEFGSDIFNIMGYILRY